MNATAKPTAIDAYTAAHADAVNLLDRINDRLHSLPAPDDNASKINWGHVGSLNEVNRQLAELMAFVDSMVS